MTEHKLKRLDKNPGALVNTDRTAAEGYRVKKQQFQRINTLEDKVNNIESLLVAILDKLNKE